MSLINNVLRELDNRRASETERANVPNEVRSLPTEKNGSSGRLFLIIGAGAVALAAVWLIPPMSPTAAPAPVANPVPIVAVQVPAVPPVPAEKPPMPIAVPPTVPGALPPAAPTPATLPAPGAVAVSPAPTLPVMAAAPATPPVAAAATAPTPVAPPPVAVASHEPVRKIEAVAVKKDESKKVPAEKPSRQEPVTTGALKLDSRLSLRNLVPESAPVAPAPTVTSPVVASPTTPANTADAEVQRAEGMLRQGIVKEAEARLRRVLTTSPEHIAARQALINLLINAKRSDEAVVVYQEGLARHPAQSPWAMSLARLQADRNDYNAAWETLSRTLPHAQQQADYRAFCGAVMQRLNRPREAAEHYRAALILRPTEGRWWVGFGLALEGDRQIPDSREAFQRARQTGSLPPELAAFVDQKLR